MLKTDHSPLPWITNNVGKSAKVARWVLPLQDFSFDLKHRAGKCHNVQTFCLAMQQENPVLTTTYCVICARLRVQAFVQQRRNPLLLRTRRTRSGCDLLCSTRTSVRTGVCAAATQPTPLADMSREQHVSRAGGAEAGIAIQQRNADVTGSRNRYSTVNMPLSDIRAAQATCPETFLLRQAPDSIPGAKLPHWAEKEALLPAIWDEIPQAEFPIGWPGDILTLDIFGSLPTARSGAGYGLVGIDHFSRWVELAALPHRHLDSPPLDSPLKRWLERLWAARREVRKEHMEAANERKKLLSQPGLQRRNRLTEAEPYNLRGQQRHWQQERSQHEETTRKLFTAEAPVDRIPILEKQIVKVKGHKHPLEQAQSNEAPGKKQLAHLGPSLREANNVIDALNAELMRLEVGTAQEEVSALQMK
ncbi:hypothetical protein Efla_000530 [Eimeria flavescens]